MIFDEDCLQMGFELGLSVEVAISLIFCWIVSLIWRE